MSAASLDQTACEDVANFAQVLLWRSALDRGCDWCNRVWLDFVGKPLEDEIKFGRSVSLHPDDRERCEAAYLEAFTARRRFTSDYRLLRHDGQYRWVRDNATPYLREGAFAGFLGACVDVTDERELEGHQKTLLAELNHRVKNNLQLIIAFLSIEMNRNKDDQVRSVLRAAVNRVHGIGTIQEQLHQTPSPVIDLAEYLPALALSMARMTAGRVVALSVEAECVHCSHHQASNLGLIVNELVSNAVKYGASADGCELALVVRRLHEGEAEIQIRDRGPGFAESLLSTHDNANARRSSLLDALARKSSAVLRRENDGGAVARLRFPLEAGA